MLLGTVDMDWYHLKTKKFQRIACLCAIYFFKLLLLVSYLFKGIYTKHIFKI